MHNETPTSKLMTAISMPQMPWPFNIVHSSLYAPVTTMFKVIKPSVYTMDTFSNLKTLRQIVWWMFTSTSFLLALMPLDLKYPMTILSPRCGCIKLKSCTRSSRTSTLMTILGSMYSFLAIHLLSQNLSMPTQVNSLPRATKKKKKSKPQSLRPKFVKTYTFFYVYFRLIQIEL